MARPQLFTSRKFLRLCAILKMPKAHVLGHLEFLWQSGYRSASEVIGDSIDVELAAEWEGESGSLADALLSVEFIDDDGNGNYSIHDFWTHCPKYVRERARTEDRLRQEGTSISEIRRVAGLRGVEAKQAKYKQAEANTQQIGSKPERFCLDNSANEQQSVSKNTLSLPSPSLPIPNNVVSNETTPSIPSTQVVYPDSFLAFWSAYPKKVGKDDALKCWKRLKLNGEVDTIVSAVLKAKRSTQWQKDGGQFIPNPSTYLNQGRWKDETEEANPEPVKRQLYQSEIDALPTRAEWEEMKRLKALAGGQV